MATPERDIIEGMFMIPNKEGEDVPFILNETQRRLDDGFTGRDVIAKARQEGVSSWYLALFTVRCLYKRNTRAVVISHDRESTERLFRRVKYFLENLRGPRPVLEFASKREFSFPKTNSMFYVGTAGARKFGRGDTITDLHCSEVAFWEGAKDLTAGLFQAVPRTGTIGLESTGNGRDFFYRRVLAAKKETSRYRLHFFDWLSFSEYDLSVDDEEAQWIIDTLDPDLEEDYLFEEVGLTPGQLKFRREKLEELEYDLDLFKQEYPITLDECFRATGRSIFHKVKYVQSKGWVKQDRDLYVLSGHPIGDGRYLIGVDVAAGIGSRKVEGESGGMVGDADSSVAEVFELKSGHQVAEWASNTVAPDVLAYRVRDLGKLFNNAYISVEANNHGLMTLSELSKIYPINLIHRRMTNAKDNDARLLTLGVLQTSRVKPLSIGKLRLLLATVWTVHSPDLKDELDSFIEDADGKLRAEEGCHDDRVMACVAAAYTYERACMMLALPKEPESKRSNDPFLLDNIVKELQGRGQNFPIAPQVRMD